MVVNDTLILFVSVALSLTSWSNPIAAGELEDSLDPLPFWFKPLNWKTKSHKLNDLFPKAKISGGIPSLDPDDEVWIVSGVKRKDFGESTFVLAYRKKKQLQYVGISTAESRKECVMDMKPDWCRNSYSKELVQRFERINTELQKQYGKPHNEHEHKNKRLRSLSWNMRGYKIRLRIDSTEHNSWSVDLFAIR